MLFPVMLNKQHELLTQLLVLSLSPHTQEVDQEEVEVCKHTALTEGRGR